VTLLPAVSLVYDSYCMTRKMFVARLRRFLDRRGWTLVSAEEGKAIWTLVIKNDALGAQEMSSYFRIGADPCAGETFARVSDHIDRNLQALKEDVP